MQLPTIDDMASENDEWSVTASVRYQAPFSSAKGTILFLQGSDNGVWFGANGEKAVLDVRKDGTLKTVESDAGFWDECKPAWCRVAGTVSPSATTGMRLFRNSPDAVKESGTAGHAPGQDAVSFDLAFIGKGAGDSEYWRGGIRDVRIFTFELNDESLEQLLMPPPTPAPSLSPTVQTMEPSMSPTDNPVKFPTRHPSPFPTLQPSASPTRSPFFIWEYPDPVAHWDIQIKLGWRDTWSPTLSPTLPVVISRSTFMQ